MTSLAVTGRERIADWIEAYALCRESALWPIDGITRTVVAELGLSEAQAQQGLGAMRRREEYCEGAYAFRLSDLAVHREADAVDTPYATMLMLTPGGLARSRVHPTSTAEMDVLFEHLVVASLASLWGPRSRAVRFAWPSDEGRPREFAPAVTWLARLMDIEPGTGYRPPRRKDGGVDVVAWRPFGDRKSGFPIVLVQCTLQSEITSKARDVELRLWSTWLDMDVDPVAALAVPEVVPRGEAWNSLNVCSMVFDRCRLAALAGRESSANTSVDWTVATVDSLRSELGLG